MGIGLGLTDNTPSHIDLVHKCAHLVGCVTLRYKDDIHIIFASQIKCIEMDVLLAIYLDIHLALYLIVMVQVCSLTTLQQKEHSGCCDADEDDLQELLKGVYRK